MAKPIKSIIQRSGLLELAEIARMFCYEKDTLLKKWHDGEPIIRELELRRAGKQIVADERNVWRVLEKYKQNLEIVIPRWRERGQDTRLSRN
jgi:hypothetical protein